MVVRCIIVTGNETSGTSCVAGMLSRLGVHMGFRLKPASTSNPRGYFEDVDYQQALFIKGRGKRDSAIHAWAHMRVKEEKKRGSKLWGLKEPWFMTNAEPTIRSILDADPSAEVKLIRVRRDEEEIARSRMVKYPRPNHTLEDYRQKVRAAADVSDRFFSQYPGQFLELYFAEVVEDPFVAVHDLVEYCFQRLPSCDWPDQGQKKRAQEFVDPKLKRF
jgi:hypothetical protein